MLIIYDSKVQWVMSGIDDEEAEVVAYFEGYLIKVVHNEITGRVGIFASRTLYPRFCAMQ